MKILNFPDLRQATKYTCGPSAVQSVLFYYGQNYRETKLSKLLSANKVVGTKFPSIANFFLKLNFKIDFRQMTIADLEKYVARQIPVIVAVQAWPGREVVVKNWKQVNDSGHYMVCVGYDKNNLIFEDPMLASKGYISKKEFLDRWHDWSNWHGKKVQYINFGLAVYGMKPKFDEHELIKIK